MPKIKYQHIEFSADRLALVAHCNAVITEYTAQGFVLTLRQLYYQMVSRDIIPNKVQEYKRLGDVVNNARMCGLIDWTAIEDRTRNLQSLSHWESPAQIVDACASQFNIDRWKTQPNRVEVWIEKDALVGVIERVCKLQDVAFFSCRGYTSQSEMWAAAMRLKSYAQQGQRPIILHLGDHDPSGIDMTRDIRDRLTLFAGTPIEIKRLALNMPQVEQYNPPPNPAKTTDSRYSGYEELHGTESWELDALAPQVIAALIRDNLAPLLDNDKWTDATLEQEEHRATLKAVSNDWEHIAEQYKA